MTALRLPAGGAVRRWSNAAVAAVGLLVFLAAWKLIVIVGDYPAFILPPPEIVARRLVTAWTDGTIPRHAGTTLVEVALGLLVGGSLALATGYALARSVVVERLVSPYIVAAQATPILALAPLLALWFGPGLLSKVVICALIVFFPIAIATMVGIRSVDARLLELARSLR
ncbi:MAG TPA: ABC transporter permease subunit, partial [Candidatus Limnocylindrales bacterium]